MQSILFSYPGWDSPPPTSDLLCLARLGRPGFSKSVFLYNCVLNSLLYRPVMYIGGWGVSPAGPPVTGKSFRVVPCVRTCVRAVLGLVRFQPNRAVCSFPFPFYPAGLSLFPYAAPAFPFSLMSIYSLFPCEHHEEMDSNEIK